MASYRDKSGRPVVVVTGMGVVTSLGAGKSENWDKLTAGESGIRAIKRFSTEGLRTRIAGTVDFVPVAPLTSPAPRDGGGAPPAGGPAPLRPGPPPPPAGARQPARRYGGGGSDRSVRRRHQGPLPRSAFSRGRPGRGRVAATPGARESIGRQLGRHLHRFDPCGLER